MKVLSGKVIREEGLDFITGHEVEFMVGEKV
jgi:hypothetical protein